MPVKRRLDFGEMPAKRAKVTTVTAVSKSQASMEALRAEQKRLRAQVSKLAKARETKYFDIVEGPDNVDYAVNATYTMCFPGQGSAFNNRIGDAISPTYITVKGYLYSDSTGVPNLVRVCLVRSKKDFVPSSITTNTATAVWQNAASVHAVDSQFYIQNREDFEVLHDEVIVVESKGITGEIKPFEINKKLRGKMTFNQSSATPQSGALYLLFTSTSTGVNGPQLDFTSRVYFKDD